MEEEVAEMEMAPADALANLKPSRRECAEETEMPLLMPQYPKSKRVEEEAAEMEMAPAGSC